MNILHWVPLCLWARGGCLGQTPPPGEHPRTDTPMGDTPLQADTLSSLGRHPLGIHPPPETATTQPTGMHSCLDYDDYDASLRSIDVNCMIDRCIEPLFVSLKRRKRNFSCWSSMQFCQFFPQTRMHSAVAIPKGVSTRHTAPGSRPPGADTPPPGADTPPPGRRHTYPGSRHTYPGSRHTSPGSRHPPLLTESQTLVKI